MAPPNPAPRRGPSVLVTDSRDAAPRPQPPSRRPTSRFITMDSVLQYTSEVPSMQKRPGQERPKVVSRTASGRPADPRLSGKFAPQNVPVPGRSTKVSEKLVLLPDTASVDDGELEEDEKGDWAEDNEGAPMRDDEETIRRRAAGLEKVKSYAERLPKSRRTEKLSRVTAYCTAQAYKLQGTAEFLREKHGVKTKLYDDCLYVAYHLPLLPGNEGYRVKSSPALKSAGGKAVLDEEIERSERRDYWEGYFGSAEEDEHSVKGESPRESPEESPGEQDLRRKNRSASLEDGPTHHDDRNPDHDRRGSDQSHRSVSPPRIPSNVFAFAEAFIFIYGVVVFWNFTEKQERDVLADLTFFAPLSGLPLVTLPLREEDFETEEFHFEYSADIPRPRIYNDMITLRSGDHMVKLTMSHAIAQSTKLSFFEEAMSAQMEDAKHVPKRLALTGQLGMTRSEVVKILGSLFKSRVDVNLSSNILDIPPFFWSSEPTLHPLYTAVREYLEIKPRTTVLNERCRVFLDLAEILSDSIADSKMSGMTWIVIGLIVVSIVVTISEVFLRFGILEGRGKGGAGVGVLGRNGGVGEVEMRLFWEMVGKWNCSCPNVDFGAVGGRIEL